MDLEEILCMQYCDLTHEIFPNFSTGLWPLIDVKISIFLNIFRNNEWILIKFCLCIDTYTIHVVTNTHYFPKLFNSITVIILSFRTNRSMQTVHTQIRLLLIRAYTVCHFVCILGTQYTNVKPLCSTLITASLSGVQIFRSFTVWPLNYVYSQYLVK